MNHTATHQARAAGASPQSGPEKLPEIRQFVAIGSGKGGVGKSTVSGLTMLGIGLKRRSESHCG
jgi:Mrp family chromosome partitioning ATPase